MPFLTFNHTTVFLQLVIRIGGMTSSPLIKTGRQFTILLLLVFHHIPSFGSSDVSYLQVMLIASNDWTRYHAQTNPVTDKTEGLQDVPTHVTITSKDIELADDVSLSFEDSFFPEGPMEPKLEDTKSPQHLNRKLLCMEVDDLNQMLLRKQLDTFQRMCVKKEVYKALMDDLTGKIKHSLSFKGKITFQHLILVLYWNREIFLQETQQRFCRAAGLFNRYAKLYNKYGQMDTTNIRRYKLYRKAASEKEFNQNRINLTSVALLQHP